MVQPDGTLVDVFHYGKGSGLRPAERSLTGVCPFDRRRRALVAADRDLEQPGRQVLDPDTGVPLRTGADIGGSMPDIAVDPGNGELYVVWEDSRFSGTHNDIALSKSTDGGLTWSDPVRGQPDARPGATAFTPTVDVLPDGTVAVTYYDIRNNTPAAGLPTDYFVAHSHDGGATWSKSRITPTSFDDETAPISRGYFLGDYMGLANDGSAFKSFFVQTNTATRSNRTDVFATTITP